MKPTDPETFTITKRSLKIYLFVLLIILAIVAFWWLRDIRVENLIRKQQVEISRVIRNTIREDSKFELLIHDVILINIDTSQKRIIKDSILNQFATFLSKKYLNNDFSEVSYKSFSPAFHFPANSDKNGNFILSEQQIQALKDHLDFLSSQVDKAIEQTKSEISNEINRVNNWITIWIGILGLLGVFVPILVNIKAFEQLKDIKKSAKEAKTESETAKTNSETAINNATDAKTKVEAVSSKVSEIEPRIAEFEKIRSEVDQIKSDIVTAKSDVVNASTESKTAIEQAQEAKQMSENTERLLITLNAVVKLNDIDANVLQKTPHPLLVIRKHLVYIHSELTACNDFYNHVIIKDCLRKLAMRLHLLSYYSFIDRIKIDLINKFASSLSTIISVPITTDSYNQVLLELNDLIAKL